MMEVLPSYLDENGLAAFYPNSAGYPFLTDHILRLSKVTAWPIPDAQRNQMLDALTNYVEGKLAKDDWRMGEWDETHRRLEAITTLSQYGRFKSSWLDTLKIQPARWTTSMLVNWLTLLKEQANISQRTQKLAQTENLLRARLTRQGSVYSLSEGQFTHWWLYDNDEATLARLIIATMDMPAWQEDQPRLMRGLLMRQKAGRWSTTLANLWGGQALRLFSERFEHESVSGSTHIVLSDQKKDIEWQSSNLDAVRLNWPDKPATLLLTQEGEGKPWVTVQSRARKILSSPESTGFTVTKTLKPLQQKVAGQWSVGDVVQVRLKMSAQSDMGWVVLDDPIPAGSTLLGRALGRDQSLVAENNAVWTWATFAEFAADSYRAYYENIYKGEWEAVYTVRLNQSGTFLLPPTRVEAMYAPEMYGLSPNKNVVVNP
jgi:hypothetical protein